MTDGELLVKVNDETIAQISEFDNNPLNIDNIDTSNYNIGTNPISVEYTGSTLFDDNTQAGSLLLTKRDITISQVEEIDAYILDVINVPIHFNDTITASGTIKVYKDSDTTPVREIDLQTEEANSFEFDTSELTEGQYTLTLELTDNDLYEDTRALTFANINVNKRPVSATINDITVNHGDITNINAIFNESINSGSIIFKVDDTQLDLQSDVTDGQATYTDYQTQQLTPGEHTITIIYSDRIYEVTNNPTATLTVNANTVSITTDDITTFVTNSSVEITAHLNVTLNSGTITFKVNDEIIGTQTPTNGEATITYDPSQLAVGTYTIKAAYSGTTENNIIYSESQEDEKTLTINKKQLTISADNQNVNKNDPATIIVEFNDTITDDVNSQVEAFINEESIGTVTIENNQATITIDTRDLEIGTHTINIRYTGNQIFEDKTTDVSLTVTPRTVEITATAESVPKGDTTIITVTLNETITDGTITIKINDETIETITEANGNTFTIENVDTNNYNIGENTITIEYTNSELYNDASTTGTLTLTTRTIDMTTTATTVPKGDTTNITINLNETVTDGTITVKINDEIINEITELNDNTITIENIDTNNYNIGENTITIEYTNSELYNDASTTGVLNLVKRTVDITTAVISVPKGDLTNITINLNESVSDGKITVKVNDEIVDELTELNGDSFELFNINTSNYNIGENTITVEYTDSELYNDASATGVLNLIKRDVTMVTSAVDVAKGDTTTITITLNDTITDGKLTVKVNDETVSEITELNNNTIIISDVDTSNYNIGENTITIEYTDSELFNDADNQATLTLVLRDVIMNVEAATVAKGDVTTITITLNDTITDGKITVKVNDETVSEITQLNNNVIVLENVDTTSYNIGDNTITVEYTDSELFNDAGASGILTLINRDINIIVSAVEVNKNDNSSITISLNDTVNDGKLSVYINDELLVELTDIYGNEFTIDDVVTTSYNIGDNNIRVEYSDSQLFNDNEAVGILTLDYRAVNLNADSISITKDAYSSSMTVTLNDTINDGTIEVIVNNTVIGSVEISEDTDEVTVDVDTSNLIVGNNSVAIKYSGSELFDDSISTSSINVRKSITNIVVDPIIVTPYKETTITARVTSENSDVLVNSGKVVFKINGKSLKDENGKIIYVQVVNGIATITYNFTDADIKNNVSVSAVYSTTSTYLSSRSDEVTIQQAEDKFAVITINPIATAKINTTITVSATVKDEDGDNINTGKVVFKLNGKTLKDENGKVIYASVVDSIASINYTIPANMKAKEYNLTAVLSSGLYAKSEGETTITLIR